MIRQFQLNLIVVQHLLGKSNKMALSFQIYGKESIKIQKFKFIKITIRQVANQNRIQNIRKSYKNFIFINKDKVKNQHDVENVNVRYKHKTDDFEIININNTEIYSWIKFSKFYTLIITTKNAQMNHTRRNQLQQFTARRAFIKSQICGEEERRNQKLQGQQSLTQRLGIVDRNICFISPKKIAYFQKIDSNCLNQQERCALVQNSKSGDKMFNRQNIKNPEMEIDYKFIKKCLSPKVVRQPLFTRRGLESQLVLKQQKNKISKQIQDQKEFTKKLIVDLKQQIIEMSKLIEEKDRQIDQKNLKISDLQRQLSDRDKKMQTSSISFKSISTAIEDRIDRLLCSNSVLPMLSLDQFQDRVGELQQKINSYEKQFKKFQIQIDILRKNKYQFQKLQTDLDRSNKKIGKLNKRIQTLIGQNKNLQNQMLKCLVQIKSRNDQSIELTYSPDKYK